MKENNITVFKDTSDDFHGNYFNHLVRVEIKINISPPTRQMVSRVSVWGNDDFGFIKDFECVYENDPLKALDLFYKVIALKGVTIDSLIKLGFEQF